MNRYELTDIEKQKLSLLKQEHIKNCNESECDHEYIYKSSGIVIFKCKCGFKEKL